MVQDAPHRGNVGGWETMAQVLCDALRTVRGMVCSCLDNCALVCVINDPAPVRVWSSCAVPDIAARGPAGNRTPMDTKASGEFAV